MRDVLAELLPWWRAGHTIGVATVVATFRSAPRPPGAAMLVGPAGEAVGSVSGGCVEGAVYEVSGEVVGSGVPALKRYGVSDDDAFAVGLTCGGILDVFVEPVSRTTFPELGAVADDIDAGRPVAVATVIDHPDHSLVGRRIVVRPEGSGDPEPAASLGSARADAAVLDDARGLLATGRSETLTYGPDGERRGEGMRVFVSSYAPKPRMLVFGAIDFAATRNASVALATLVAVGSAPLFSGFLGRLTLGHRLPRIWYAATAVALVGLVIDSWSGITEAELGPAVGLGVTLAIGSGVSIAAYTVAATRR